MEIIATPRGAQGTGASRRLRNSGKVPGIVYGGNAAPKSIELDHNALYHSLRQEAFHASILTMNVGGQKEQVLLRDVQMHPFRQQVLHVDFQRVAADQKIHMKVPLHFVNADVAPGVKTAGGIVSHILTELEISCLPKDLPEFIEVDLGNLNAGHPLHLADLKLPNGVEAVTRGENPAVAAIVIPRAVAAEEEAEAAAAAAASAAAAAAAPAAAEKKEEKK
ncbi:MAG: 50S ribosomal protein L25/general stress protein Ctc [Pseudomonadota bacterium]